MTEFEQQVAEALSGRDVRFTLGDGELVSLARIAPRVAATITAVGMHIWLTSHDYEKAALTALRGE